MANTQSNPRAMFCVPNVGNININTARVVAKPIGKQTLCKMVFKTFYHLLNFLSSCIQISLTYSSFLYILAYRMESKLTNLSKYYSSWWSPFPWPGSWTSNEGHRCRAETPIQTECTPERSNWFWMDRQDNKRLVGMQQKRPPLTQREWGSWNNPRRSWPTSTSPNWVHSPKKVNNSF